jgi:hypothetical protein
MTLSIWTAQIPRRESPAPGTLLRKLRGHRAGTLNQFRTAHADSGTLQEFVRTEYMRSAAAVMPCQTPLQVIGRAAETGGVSSGSPPFRKQT